MQECDILGGLVRGVSDNFWQQRSPLMNQALLCLAICLVAEVSTADAIAEALLPLAHVFVRVSAFSSPTAIAHVALNNVRCSRQITEAKQRCPLLVLVKPLGDT